MDGPGAYAIHTQLAILYCVAASAVAQCTTAAPLRQSMKRELYLKIGIRASHVARSSGCIYALCFLIQPRPTAKNADLGVHLFQKHTRRVRVGVYSYLTLLRSKLLCCPSMIF